MFCRKCGSQIPDDSAFCPSCGTPVAGGVSAGPEEYTLTIDRKSQLYLLNPPIKLTIDGKTRLSIDNGRSVDVKVSPGPHKLVFSGSMRTQNVDIDVKGDMVLEIGFSRATGAITVETVK